MLITAGGGVASQLLCSTPHAGDLDGETAGFEGGVTPVERHPVVIGGGL
jgi:hypothetical protein